MGNNPYATWKEYEFENLPDDVEYVNGFYVFNGGYKTADYNLFMLYYDQIVRTTSEHTWEDI